jgi:protein O-mannosyl-transferase
VTSELVRLTERNSSGKKVTIYCSTVLVLILGFLTWEQSHAYRDIETLYRETLARNPASWLAHNNLGLLLAVMPGRLPDAIVQYEATLRIRPDYAEARDNLGNAMAQIKTPGSR